MEMDERLKNGYHLTRRTATKGSCNKSSRVPTSIEYKHWREQRAPLYDPGPAHSPRRRRRRAAVTHPRHLPASRPGHYSVSGGARQPRHPWHGRVESAGALPSPSSAPDTASESAAACRQRGPEGDARTQQRSVRSLIELCADEGEIMVGLHVLAEK